MDWISWINQNGRAFARGEKLVAPAFLPHPSFGGFRAITLATPAGQCSDWVVPDVQGGRIHVHLHCDGRMEAHRDRYDPDQGLESLVKHLVTETFVGPTLAVCGLVWLVSNLDSA